MDKLFRHLRDYHPLTPQAEQALADEFEEITLGKNEFLLQEGKTCRHLYFLEQGAIRGYYNLEEKEITHWFAFENDFVTSFHSFITQEPSVENIQLLEGSVLRKISKEKLTALFNRFHEIERLVRIAYEKYYIRLEERYVNSQFRSASERYENLLEHTPHIIERVPLGQISSYLGISQETLSRIRAKT
ncbi:MAG: Crp/Fnr family transcriptional regulator [Chitinophagaceae bacterium]|nr:MAG: Crp/Fnr family transcriptional regulator [Chitinophagaceae bacterium]